MPYKFIEAPEKSAQPESPSFFSEALRHTARTGSRVAEQIAGFPGDIASLLNEFVARPVVKAISGQPGVPYEETQLSKILPTTAEHRKRTESALGEIVKPKNKYESFVDDFISDATSLALPGIKGSKIPTRMPALASLGANLIEKGVKDVSGDEKKASVAKMGSLFLLSLLDKPKAAQAVQKAYAPLQEKAAKLKPVDADVLESSLKNLQKKVSKGTLAPSEKFVFDEADLILKKIKDGKIPVDEIWAAKRSLNEKLPKALFDIPSREGQQRARKLASNISHSLDDALSATQRQDPQFYKDLKQANKAYKAIQDSNLMERFVEKNLRNAPVTAGLLHLVGGPAGNILAAGALPYSSGKLLYRTIKSPILRKQYGKTLSAIMAEDAAAFNRELNKLDREFQKQEKVGKFRFINP